MMKPVFFFLLALTAVLAATANEEKGIVLDTDGDKVLCGHGYYMIPFVSSEGGGVNISRTSKKCHVEIVQESSRSNYGIPVIFSTCDGDYLSEYYGSRIAVDTGDRICMQQLYWRIEKTSDGIIWVADPDRNSALRFFFNRDGKGYKTAMMRILVDANGVRHLAYEEKGKVFWFKLKKAKKPTTSLSQVI